MGAEPFHAGKKVISASRKGDIQIKETDRREYFQYRHVAVPDECLRFGHCHYIQQEPAALRGDLAIGAYGILNRLLMLFVMVIMGLTMGMQPIVGYNHGAHKFGRVKQTLKILHGLQGGASLRWDLFSANFSLIWLLICLQTIKNLQHWHALGCKSES